MKKISLIMLLLCSFQIQPAQKYKNTHKRNKNTQAVSSQYFAHQNTLKNILVCGSLGLVSGASWALYSDEINDVSPSTEYIMGNVLIELPLKYVLQRSVSDSESTLNRISYLAASYSAYYLSRLCS